MKPKNTAAKPPQRMEHDQTGEFDYGVEGGQTQKHGQDRTDGTDSAIRQTEKRDTPVSPASPAAGATSSANSTSADPDVRHASLDKPVSEVTRHI